MDFEVTIDNFEGPLDLMLHLIKEKELDLFNLNIELLTEQYILYIHQMEQLKLDIASEYLSELALLIELKSKKLLNQSIDSDEIADDYQQSSQDIVNRLLEYQKYKDITQQFQDLYQQRSLQYEKPQAQIINQWIDIEQNYDNASAYDLIKAMNKCLQRYKLAQPYQVSITKQSLTVDQRKMMLKDKFDDYSKTFTLEDTLNDCKDIYEIVINFLAILDLVNETYLSFAIVQQQVYFKKV
ncbi:MAG: segregation and condensation protein A [Erysipelotrichaceae bacterium]